MKDKHINDLFNTLSPSETQKENIYNSITIKNDIKNKHNMTVFPIRKALVAVSCLAIITIVAIPLINNIKINNNALNDTTHLTTVSKANKYEFSGFIMTVYACEKKDNYLSTNYKKDNIATVLTPNVELLLSNFSPLTNSVPGLPFTFDFNKSDSSSVIADDMIITVDNGELCTWNMETGIVTSEGTSISCKAGDTLYWSPLIPLDGDEDVTEDSKYNGVHWNKHDGLVERAQITVTAMKNSKEIGKQIISIAEIDNNYYAKIGTLIRNKS